jgi:hypothetical protein
MTNTEKKEESDAQVHVEVNDELDAELEKLLQTPPLEGLTDAQVAERLAQFGKNGMLRFPLSL